MPSATFLRPKNPNFGVQRSFMLVPTNSFPFSECLANKPPGRICPVNLLGYSARCGSGQPSRGHRTDGANRREADWRRILGWGPWDCIRAAEYRIREEVYVRMARTRKTQRNVVDLDIPKRGIRIYDDWNNERTKQALRILCYVFHPGVRFMGGRKIF